MRVLLFSGLLLLSLEATASAQSKLACSDGRGRVKGLQKQNKLLEARDVLLACARPSCPRATKQECQSLLGDASKLIPSVLISAKDERGNPLVDVTVEVDGAKLQDGLTGIAVDLDPGERAFRFKSPGRATVERKETILVGEQGRPLTVTFAAEGTGPVAAAPKPEPSPPAKSTPVSKPQAATPAPPPTPTPAAASPAPLTATAAAKPPESAPSPRTGPAWVPVIALAVAGGGFLAASIGMGVGAKSESDDLRGSCAPKCSDDQLSSMNTKLILSDVFLGASLLSFGGAAVVYFLTKPSARTSQSFAPRLQFTF